MQNTASPEWRYWCWRWVFGIYGVGLACPFRAACFTGLGCSLHEASTHSAWLGVASPRHLAFSIVHNNAAHCVHTAHLVLSDKWFWRKVQPFLRFHHTTRCFMLWLSKHFSLILDTTVLFPVEHLFTSFLSSLHPFYSLNKYVEHMFSHNFVSYNNCRL